MSRKFKVYSTSVVQLVSRVQLFVAPWTAVSQAPLSVGLPRLWILEWVAISFSRGFSQPRDWILVSCIGRWILYPWATREAHTTCEKSKWSHSVQISHSVMSDSLWPHESQHARPPCPSPTPGVYSNSCPSSQWYHPAISSSVVPFSACPQSLPASESFPMSQLVAWGGQSIAVSASASVLPMNTQDWSPLGWTGWIFFQSKGLSRVFSNTTVYFFYYLFIYFYFLL